MAARFRCVRPDGGKGQLRAVAVFGGDRKHIKSRTKIRAKCNCEASQRL